METSKLPAIFLIFLFCQAGTQVAADDILDIEKRLKTKKAREGASSQIFEMSPGNLEKLNRSSRAESNSTVSNTAPRLPERPIVKPSKPILKTKPGNEQRKSPPTRTTIPAVSSSVKKTRPKKSTDNPGTTLKEKFKKHAAEKEAAPKASERWSNLGSGGSSAAQNNSSSQEGDRDKLLERKSEIEALLAGDSSTKFGSMSISEKARLKKELKELKGVLATTGPADEKDILRHTESIIDKVKKTGSNRN